VFASAAMGSTLLAEAGLSFLGLGVPPPEPTWGTMVVDGQGSSVFRANPMAILAPGLLVGVVVTAFNLIGDGLRDAFDPRSGG
jgi:peptide/nickel transport system permease protein